MKILLLLALLGLPACAEVNGAWLDSAGVVSLNWVSEVSEAPIQSLVLEGRNALDQSWEPLQVWNLEPSAGPCLRTPPNSARSEYRVLTFGDKGYLGQSPVVVSDLAVESLSFYRRR